METKIIREIACSENFRNAYKDLPARITCNICQIYVSRPYLFHSEIQYLQSPNHIKVKHMDKAIQAKIDHWMSASFDEATRSEIKKLQQENPTELADA